jgi:Na+/proline symporter
MFLYILGMVLFVFYRTRPDLGINLKNPDAVVPEYAATMLSNGLAGVVVASIFAGSMSTVSASLNSLATSSVVDVYKQFLGTNRSDAHYASASRWATVLWGTVATVGALYAFRLGPLVTSFLKIQSLIGGVVLGIFLLGVLGGRATGAGVLVGAAVGLAVVVYVSFFTPVSVYWHVVTGCVATGITGWLLSVTFSRLSPTPSPPRMK